MALEAGPSYQAGYPPSLVRIGGHASLRSRVSTLDVITEPSGPQLGLSGAGLLIFVDYRIREMRQSQCLAWLVAALQLASEQLVELRVVAVTHGDGDLPPILASAGRDGTASDSGDFMTTARILCDVSGKWDQTMRGSGSRGSPSALLVRPDGHIAARWEQGEGSGVVEKARGIIMEACMHVLGKDFSSQGQR